MCVSARKSVTGKPREMAKKLSSKLELPAMLRSQSDLAAEDEFRTRHAGQPEGKDRTRPARANAIACHEKSSPSPSATRHECKGDGTQDHPKVRHGE